MQTIYERIEAEKSFLREQSRRAKEPRPDIKTLRAALEANRNPPLKDFNLQTFKSDCGTAGCLIGNYREELGQCQEAYDRQLAVRRSIPSRLWHYLFHPFAFCNHHGRWTIRGTRLDIHNLVSCRARLEKTILYLEAKERVYAAPDCRTREGNWGIAREVSEVVSS